MAKPGRAPVSSSKKDPLITLVDQRRNLVDCAMGRLPADLVIKNVRWVCVQSGEIIPSTDIAIHGERIAYVGADASHTIGKNTKVIEAGGQYAVPGLLDAHMHVESTMLTVTEFTRAVIPHGTTGIFIDPHEIANVFGLKGVRLMVDEAAQQPIHVWVQVPSCIPSAPGLETPGAEMGPDEIAEALSWDGIIGLGEVMNFPGVAAGDDKMLREISLTRSAGKTIGGHYASPDLGLPFHAYAAGGAQDDHEGTQTEDAIARARQGMKVMMRYGSAWQDVVTQVKAVTEYGLDSRGFLLCTDDSHSHTIFNDGHMDRVIRHAVMQGLSPMKAIQMATINTAEHFGLSHEIGLIAPGRFGDILLVPNLAEFHPEMVICKGKLISQAGYLLVDLPPFEYPHWAINSVHLPKPLVAADFSIQVPSNDQVTVHVIEIIENQAPTRHVTLTVKPVDKQIKADSQLDLCKAALVERHHNTGKIQMGLVTGFGFKQPCAVATTVAHDSHQLIVVGNDDDCLAKAANVLRDTQGGQVVVINGEVKGLVELPIAGLMSNESGQTVARKAANVLAGYKECGCSLNNPNMQVSLLGLVVIPELRLSDLGLVDTTAMKFIKLVDKA